MVKQLSKEDKKVVLTCRNYDEYCYKVLRHLDIYINKFAFNLTNAVGSSEDYRQELILKAMYVFRQYEFQMTVLEEKRVEDLIFLAVHIIHNRYVDLRTEFSKKKDTSLYTHRLDDTENRNPDKDYYDYENNEPEFLLMSPDYSYEEMEVEDLVHSLIENLKVSELPYETIGYLKESLDPSPKIQQCYEKWLQVTNPKNPHKNKGIPAKVICEALNIEYSKMGKIKEIIGLNLIKLGVDPSRISNLVTIADDSWKQYGLRNPKENKSCY